MVEGDNEENPFEPLTDFQVIKLLIEFLQYDAEVNGNEESKKKLRDTEFNSIIAEPCNYVLIPDSSSR